MRAPRVAAAVVACVVLATACVPRTGVIERTPSSGPIVVPTEFANGRVEITIQPRYTLGSPTRIDVVLLATRGTVTGPVDARVMASGIGGGAGPSEVLVRRLDATAVTARAGARATTSVTWSGDDEFGARVPADAYVLLLEFDANDGSTTRTVRATATLQMTD